MTLDLILRNLVVYSIQVALVVVVAMLIPLALRLRAPRPKLIFWQIVLIFCLALPLVQRWRSEPVPQDATVTFSSGPAYAIQNSAPPSRPIPWLEIGVGLLVLGAVCRLAWLGVGLARMRGYRRTATPLDPQPADIRDACVRLGVWADFAVSEEVSSPVTFGFRNPVVLTPPTFPDLPADERSAIAHHELLHVQRRDWCFTLAEELVRAILWFHPAVWFLLSRIHLAREQAVDEAVVRLTRKPKEYLNALLGIAAARLQPDLAPAPLFLRRRHLKQRVASIVKGVHMSKSRVILSMTAALAVLPFLAIVISTQFPLIGAPQVVGEPDSTNVELNTGPFKLLHRSAIIYPNEARARSISGDVVVAVSTNEQGEVIDARVVSGPELLRKPVLQSVLGWHFSTTPPLPQSFEIGVRFQPAPATQSKGPATVAVITPGGTPKNWTINRIDLSALPEELRTAVANALPVREGDSLGPQDMARVNEAIKQVDSHLTAGMNFSGDQKTSLVVWVLPQGVRGGVVAGIRGGISGGVPGGTVMPPPPPPAPLATEGSAPPRIRVGGNVQAQNLIEKVTPVYPPLARQAHIQGTVQLQAVIGKDGHITDLQVISGHPLLVPPSLEAVKQWVYRPTLLNGNPVDVITQIDVNFTLAEQPPPTQQ